MKILKYIAFALGGVAALLIAGGLFIYATFDADKLKSELTQIVKEKKQRTLTIDGEVALSFWPSIGVRLGRTRLSEHASDAEFAALDSARVSLAVLPLLSKQVVIDRLELAGVGATLVRGKDGKLNIDDLLSTDDKPDSQSVRFDVASIRFKDGKLTYRDEQSARSVTLSALDLTTGKRLPAAWLEAMVKSSERHSDEAAVAGYLDAWAKTNILDKVQGRKLPVLVIPGEHDPALGVETCKATWMQHYPQAKMEVMTNAGHYPMDETPLALVAAFERFLAAQPQV